MYCKDYKALFAWGDRKFVPQTLKTLEMRAIASRLLLLLLLLLVAVEKSEPKARKKPGARSERSRSRESAEQLVESAFALHQTGNFLEAVHQYRKAIRALRSSSDGGSAAKTAHFLSLCAHNLGADLPLLRRGGTVVVIQGPRFSTRAESRWFNQMGWHAINMTAYPEGHLARELEICYANISLITDYDVGLEGMPGVKPVSLTEVFEVFARNNDKLRDLLFSVIPRIPAEQDSCGSALDGAVISGH